MRHIQLLAFASCAFAFSTRAPPRQRLARALRSAVDDDENDLVAELATTLEPGVVLLAPPSEYDTFLRHQLLLVVERDSEGGGVGLILDRPTALSIGEAAPGAVGPGALAANTLYMGGEHGGQKVVLLHEYESIDGARPVGASGLCVGGVAHAVACVEGDVLPPSEFKFFFNEYIWLPGAIEQMVDRDDDGSFSPRGFLPLRLDTRLVLRQQGKAGKLWSEVRRLLRSRGISLSRDDAGEEDAQSA